MELARIFNGKKFMWDGKVYTNEQERREIAQKYKDDGFEVELVEEGELILAGAMTDVRIERSELL